MNSKFIDEMNQEFKEFKETASMNPPKEISDKILNNIRQDLNPSAFSVFGKMGMIHMLIGMITLSLCPQFGFRIFGQGLGLMKFFMSFGEYGCTIICGGFFVGASVFASSIWLRSEELKVLRKHRFLQVSALTFLSLGAFIMLDSEIIFGFAAVWALGSIFGGIAMLELGRWFKLRMRFA